MNVCFFVIKILRALKFFDMNCMIYIFVTASPVHVLGKETVYEKNYEK